MSSQSNYFLLRKNNSLQTIESLIDPYVYASKDRDETLRIKQQLELIYLRALPIHFHFDHIKMACDEEIITFDKFLIAQYGFSFLGDGFDHSQKKLNGQILYTKQFPKHLMDQELLTIQKRMDKYHFILIEQEPNNKAVIALNPWPIENPLRDGEIFKLQDSFDSKKEAQQFMDRIIEGQFDLDGSYLTVGDIKESELTNRTKEILNAQFDIRYKSRHEDNGEKFVSANSLSETINGMKTLMELYDSIGKKPYEVIELK